MKKLAKPKPLRLGAPPTVTPFDPYYAPPGDMRFGPLPEPDPYAPRRLKEVVEHILQDARKEEEKMAEQAPVLRCKVSCGTAMPALDQDGHKFAEQVSLYAVYSNTEENKAWSKATPSAQFQLFISNPDAWGKLTQGHEFYVDFIPVEATS